MRNRHPVEVQLVQRPVTISFFLIRLRARQGGFALCWRYAHGAIMNVARTRHLLAVQLEVCVNLFFLYS